MLLDGKTGMQFVILKSDLRYKENLRAISHTPFGSFVGG